MLNLLGEYEITVDAKGRFLLPVTFRKQLPEGENDRFVLTRGFENCLSLYPLSTWAVESEKIISQNSFDPKARELKRRFLNGAAQVEVDSAGRLLIPKPLLVHAQIQKDAVILAQGDRAEIWDETTYRNYMNSGSAEDFSRLAAEVLGGQKDNANHA